MDTAEATTQARIAKLTPAQRTALARKAGKASGAAPAEEEGSVYALNALRLLVTAVVVALSFVGGWMIGLGLVGR